VRLTLEPLEERTLLQGAPLMVTTNADSGPGSLRQAIIDSNASAGPNTIDFNLPTDKLDIQPLTALPTLTTPVMIDGTSEPGYSGTPLVVLTGSPTTVTTGLVLAAGSSTVKGLVFNGFQADALELESNNNIVQGNFIGTSASGGSMGGTTEGTGITVNGSNNTIGGTTSAARNVISGNQKSAIAISFLNTQLSAANNVVLGNYIGTDKAGNSALPNMDGITLDSVTMVNGSGQNTIGGTANGAGNVISGNNRYGVFLTIPSGADIGAANNVVEGNLIGTNAAGSSAVPNVATGIVFGGGNGDTIGGTAAGAGNLISGNGDFGIVATSGDLVIEGNKIGTDLIGTVAIPNGLDGIYVVGGSFITIGATTPGGGNLISGNGRFGVFLLGEPTASGLVPSRSNMVQDNIIGLGQGAGGLPNKADGIALFDGAIGNIIGGTTPGSGNLISGNGRFGVYLNGTGTSGNVIEGNRIGTSVDATFGQGNTLDGIAVFAGPSNNTIGGTMAGARNIISGNGRDGVYLANAGPNNFLEGNFIGTSGDGGKAVGNSGNGIALESVTNATIGGTATGAGNVISGNTEGVVIIGAGASANLVEGNFIGADQTGGTAVANTAYGVDVQGGASGNIIGGTAGGAGNTIAFNGRLGVLIGASAADTTTIGDSVLGNSIFGNDTLGIDLGNDGATPNTPGGPHSGPNHLQNFPTITAVMAQGTGTEVLVSLNSTPGHVFRIELFTSASGQGRFFLGAGTLSTGADGNGSTVVNLATPFASLVGQKIVATATDQSTGDTSEFSFPAFAVGG
jgi:titin